MRGTTPTEENGFNTKSGGQLIMEIIVTIHLDLRGRSSGKLQKAA
jgi:hypothetical protein